MIKILNEALPNQITNDGHLNDWNNTTLNKNLYKDVTES